MKVWEWIAELSRYPAGAEVYFNAEAKHETTQSECLPDPVPNFEEDVNEHCLNVSFRLSEQACKELGYMFHTTGP